MMKRASANWHNGEKEESRWRVSGRAREHTEPIAPEAVRDSRTTSSSSVVKWCRREKEGERTNSLRERERE